MVDERSLPGSGKPYVSPYGKFEGLKGRLAAFGLKHRQHRVGPFYAGFIADLEVVLRFLNATEFAEHLRVHGNDEEMRWAADILEALDDHEQHALLREDIERVLVVPEGTTHADAVEASARLGDQVRDVLVEAGALAADDTETDVPALLRALLS